MDLVPPPPPVPKVAVEVEIQTVCAPAIRFLVFSWLACSLASTVAAEAEPLPIVDLSPDTARQVVVAAGTDDVYQGHPTTLLLPDGKTIYCVWTLGHGGACGPMKRSDDGGRTWSELLEVPENWHSVRNCPALYRLVDPDGTARLFVFAGQGPDGTMHQSVSTDEGRTWSPMQSNGLVCVMPFCTITSVDNGKRLIGLTNIRRPGETQDPRSNVVAQSESTDGGLSWSPWQVIVDLGALKPCEPEVIRSPDGAELLCLLRENVRTVPGHFITSRDEGRTWSAVKTLPAPLHGDRHKARYAPDGRLVVVFRDMGERSPTRNHFVAWVGHYDDIAAGAAGDYKLKLLHSHKGSDCGYPGLELLPDGTFVATTYVKYRPGSAQNSVVSTRFKLTENDPKPAGDKAKPKAEEKTKAKTDEETKADKQTDIRELKLRDWQPRSMLVTETTELERPKFPAIDVHNHLGGGRQTLTPDRVGKYLEEMNAAGVRTVVNLDGGWGDRLKETVAALDEAHPGRFLTFALIDFSGIDNDDWSQREARRLAESFAAGAKGLKFHKSLGLTVRYQDGRLMKVDDKKLDPIWRVCAEHRRPVMIHVADPAAFFTPLDARNERWHELNEHPGWLFFGERFPPREEILAQLERVVAAHPETTFVGAHAGNNAEDLGEVARWLDAYPNFFIDIDARISELGRQPYTARRFLIKYQDRVMFGTDTTPRREAFRIYYRFLETDDEYFDCAESHHLQGFWRIYGVFLPDEVLEKIYSKNAERILFAAADSADEASETAEEKPLANRPELRVPRTDDFKITGDGSNPAWQKAAWTPLNRRPAAGKSLPYDARFKMLASQSGVYVLFSGSDARLTATMKEDFLDLWNEDVYEFFFWTDERLPLYFEYEISPLGYELPIIIPNVDGKFLGWRPWHYEGDRKIRKATSISGGQKESGAKVTGWTAEIFVPYSLLAPLGNVPPQPGTRWRANFYRVDYDDDHHTAWDWARVGPSFHEYQKFGTLVFE